MIYGFLIKLWWRHIPNKRGEFINWLLSIPTCLFLMKNLEVTIDLYLRPFSSFFVLYMYKVISLWSTSIKLNKSKSGLITDKIIILFFSHKKIVVVFLDYFLWPFIHTKQWAIKQKTVFGQVHSYLKRTTIKSNQSDIDWALKRQNCNRNIQPFYWYMNNSFTTCIKKIKKKTNERWDTMRFPIFYIYK